MPFSAAIQASIGATVEPLRVAGAEAATVAGKISEDITKKFAMKQVGQTLATALGLNLQNVAESVSRFITGVSKEQEAGYKRLEELTTQVADREMAAARERLSAEQRYQLALQERDKLVQRIEENAGKTQADQLRLAEDRLARLDKEREMEQALAQLETERAAVTKQMMAEEEMFAKAKQEWAEQERKALIEAEAENLKWYKERAALDEKLKEQRLAALKPAELALELERQLAELKKQQGKLDKDSNEYKALQVKINQTNLDLEGARAAAAERVAEAEKQVTAEKEKQYKINTVGRGDSALSATELSAKIQQLRQSIFQRQQANPFGADFLLNPERLALSQALAEQQTRARAAQFSSFFGEDRARGMFGQVSDQRWQELLRGVDTSASGRIADGLQRLNEQLERGIPTVLTGTSP